MPVQEPPATQASDSTSSKGDRTDPPISDVAISQLEASSSSGRRLALATFVSLILITLAGAVGAWLFRDELIAISRQFVAVLGGPGVALGFYIPDAFTVPLPNDAFSAFGLLGGLGFWPVVAWGTLGSVTGGSTGWLIGRSLVRRSVRLQRILARQGADFMVRLQRGGVLFLAVAAVTPLPYSVVCWGAGAVGMRFPVFFSVSLLRSFRVAFYLWLLQQGFVSLGG